MNTEDNLRLYTGPLTVAAACGCVDQPQDTGSHTVIILATALSSESSDHGRRLRVRMEMTPEDAEDAAASLIAMAKAAKEKRR